MRGMRKQHRPGQARGTRSLCVALAAWAGFLLAGCQTDEAPTRLVNPSPFAQPAGPRERTSATYTQASIDVATRVDAVGRKLLAANPQVGFRPLFTAGIEPQPEVFHKGTSEIVVTDGLVKQCKTDGELAAVLATELGKMVAEQEALTGGPVDVSRRRTPAPELRIGTGISGSEDTMYLIERNKFDGKDRTAVPPPSLPPDPQVLARTYLKHAGFADASLEAVEPLLKDAEKNSTREIQMKSAPATNWTKAGGAR
jgi:hypothetical protein